MTTSNTEPISVLLYLFTLICSPFFVLFFSLLYSSIAISLPFSLNYLLPLSHFLLPHSPSSPVSSLAPLHIPVWPIPADMIVVIPSSIHGDGDL